MQRGGVRPAICDREADKDVVGRILGVFGQDIEVAAVVEDAGIDEFEFRIEARATAVLLDQPGVGEFGLGIFVKRL